MALTVEELQNQRAQFVQKIDELREQRAALLDNGDVDKLAKVDMHLAASLGIADRLAERIKVAEAEAEAQRRADRLSQLQVDIKAAEVEHLKQKLRHYEAKAEALEAGRREGELAEAVNALAGQLRGYGVSHDGAYHPASLSGRMQVAEIRRKLQELNDGQ